MEGIRRKYVSNSSSGGKLDALVGGIVTVIGDHSRFGADLSQMVADAEKATAGGTRLNLVMALSYGAP